MTRRPANIARLLIVGSLLGLSAPLWAEEETPSPPEEVTTQQGQPPRAVPGSDVVIIQHKDETVEEYRIGGRIYMIKVQPGKGVPYYLVDTDGDGKLESHYSDLTEDILIPQWVIFRWKR